MYHPEHFNAHPAQTTLPFEIAKSGTKCIENNKIPHAFNKLGI
jgi:hypothetical protein